MKCTYLLKSCSKLQFLRGNSFISVPQVTQKLIYLENLGYVSQAKHNLLLSCTLTSWSFISQTC